jgi:hypothetical protein
MLDTIKEWIRRINEYQRLEVENNSLKETLRQWERVVAKQVVKINELEKGIVKSKLEEEMLKKYPPAKITYKGRSLPFSKKAIIFPVNCLITSYDPFIVSDLISWKLYRTGESHETLIPKIYKKIQKKYYKYDFDKNIWGRNEVWEFPFEMRAKGFGEGFDCDSWQNFQLSYYLAAGVHYPFIRGVAGMTNLGGHCFSPSTKVITNKGHLPISEIVIGDFVLTKNGFKKVINTFVRNMERDEKCIEIYPSGVPEPLVCTKEHMFFVKRSPRCFSFKKRAKTNYFDTGEWVAAENLKETDILYIPLDNTIIDKKTLTPDFCRLLGYYLGDGNIQVSYSKNKKIKSARLRFSLNQKGRKDKLVLPDIRRIYKQWGGKNKISVYDYKNSKSRIVTIYDTNFAKEVLSLCGEPNNKFVHHTLLHLPLTKQKELVKGLFLTDGSFNKSPQRKITFSNTSKNIVYALCFLLRRLNISYFVNRTVKKSRFSNKPSENFTVGISNCDFSLKQTSKNNSTIKYIEGFALSRVRKINKSNYWGKVFDLEVEDEHNYVVGGVLTHNSTVYIYSEKSGKWHHLNSTYGRLYSKVSDFPTHQDAREGKDKIGIKEVWFSWDLKRCYYDFKSKKVAKELKEFTIEKL